MANDRSSARLYSDSSSPLRSLILSQFEPAIASQLIEFGKFLSTLDADVLIFMARKSLCLYDLLRAIGIPQSERVVLSDRVLDLDTRYFKGKHIALIDDTLIVGTTLAKTRDFVASIPASKVSIHVFCADVKWHQEQIVRPDTIFLRADDRTVMTFCAALVRAMSLLPRPYLVDFPMTTPTRVRLGDLQCLLSATSWRSFRLSSELQIQHGAEAYTFLPRSETQNEFLNSISGRLRPSIEIAKIRAFGRYVEGVLWIRLVPIVTVAPLENATVSHILQGMLDGLPHEDDSRPLSEALTNPQAQHRFIQFLLSAALGRMFFERLSSSIGSVLQIAFDEEDIERHYGPGLRESILRCIPSLDRMLLGPPLSRSEEAIQPSSIPNLVGALANEVVKAAEPKVPVLDGQGFGRNLVADCATLFVEMYRIREIPARDEAARLGPRVTSASGSEAPFRDRLSIGLPWRSIAKYLRRTSGVSIPGRYADTMSLALDICNDLGIVVPITSTCDGITFRAYRYGEDAPFGDSELRLAYESVAGFLKATDRDDVPHLSIEKLMVFLVRAGVATKFLRPFYGTSGTDGTARVGFGLKGAVVILSRGPRDRIDRDIWLTYHLRERGVLEVNERGLYTLGHAPASDGNTRLALTSARQTGLMLGLCVKAKGKSDGAAPLDDASLILLMTCCTPRDTAAALQVELSIFGDWYRSTRTTWERKIKWDDPVALSSMRDTLVQSPGHEAIHSGLLKYSGYKSRRTPEIIRDCSEYLDKRGDFGLLKDLWDATWHMIASMQVPEEESTFERSIAECAEQISGLGIAITVIELALECALISRSQGSHSRLRRSVEKLQKFNDVARGVTGISTYLLKLGSIGEMTVDTIMSLNFESIVPVCVRHIDGSLERVDFLIEKIEPLVEEFGRIRGMHKYKYFLYYDIVDSTVTKIAQVGGDSETQENRVDRIKRTINKALEQLAIIARKNRGEVYCTNGDDESDNDGKNIFFSGKMARHYVEECIRRLLELTDSFPGIHLRIYVLPCNFVGSDAFRYEGGVEVKGQRFWTNWSRVLKSGKPLETAVGLSSSFLLVGGKSLPGELGMSFADWSRTTDTVLEVELAGSFRRIEARYGALRIPEIEDPSTAHP